MNNEKRVLVVDDEFDVRELLAMSLEGMYRVDSVTNGAEALELLRREKFDAMLLDLMMPVMDGAALLRELETRRIALPIALTSAHHQAFKVAKLHGIHALSKPYSPEDVKRWLAQVFGRGR